MLEPLPEELVLAYRRTHFVLLEAPALILRIGALAAEADAFLIRHGAQSAVIISAWNPFSEALQATENVRRGENLNHDVYQAGLTFVPAEGRDPEEKWPSEASICVLDPSPALVRKWMRRFEQNAVVRFEIGLPIELVFHPDLRPSIHDYVAATLPATANRARLTHNVYVIRLDSIVLQDKRFRAKNPQYVEGKPCVYVGMTGKSPEERFTQHKLGYKSNKYARKLGLYLVRRQFERMNPMSYDECSKQEVALADRLRKRGWAVWQA